ncbi:MAG: RDD family protein [Kofleriaceae bacterium]
MSQAEPALLGAPRAEPARSVVTPVEPAPRRTRAAAPTVTVVGFWRRLAAAAVDAAIIAPVAAVLIAVVCSIASIRLPPSRARGLDFWLDLMLTSDPAMVTALVILLTVTVIYLLVFQATVGQTLGMRVLGLRIIDVYGERPSVAKAGLRTAGYLANLATLSLGFLWIGFDAEKRGLHDWIAGTYVIRV